MSTTETTSWCRRWDSRGYATDVCSTAIAVLAAGAAIAARLPAIASLAAGPLSAFHGRQRAVRAAAGQSDAEGAANVGHANPTVLDVAEKRGRLPTARRYSSSDLQHPRADSHARLRAVARPRSLQLADATLVAGAAADGGGQLSVAEAGGRSTTETGRTEFHC